MGTARWEWGGIRGIALLIGCLVAASSVGLAQDVPTVPVSPTPGQTSNPASDQRAGQQAVSLLGNAPAQTPGQAAGQIANQTANQPPAQAPSQTPDQTPKSEKKDPGQVARDAEEETKKLGEETLEKVRDWESGWITGPYVGKERRLVAMNAKQRREIYWQQTLTSPTTYIKGTLVAAIDQARQSPAQWGEGWGAYGERFASREGQFITANSLAALGNAALHYEPRYDQCRCSGFRARTRHAILRNFLTYDRSEQDLRPQWALYGGAFGGGAIATAWKPHPRNALVNGGYAVLGQAGYGALLNVFTEFAEDINRKLGGKRR